MQRTGWHGKMTKYLPTGKELVIAVLVGVLVGIASGVIFGLIERLTAVGDDMYRFVPGGFAGFVCVIVLEVIGRNRQAR